MNILTINGGSSSIRFAVFESDTSLRPIWKGKVEGVGQSQGTFMVEGFQPEDHFLQAVSVADHVVAMGLLMEWIQDRMDGRLLAAIGHRVVHGGPRYREPQLVDAAMLEELARIRFFDPEHLPAEIALMKTMAAKFLNVPQVACFDTAFHRTMPRMATQLPIPRHYEAQGLQRYGFHGLSYAYLMQELERVAGAQAAQGRVILAHLGNGASMVAVREGRSLDTTMALTPAAGLMMSTRTGDIDPGIASYLMRGESMSAAQFDHLINHESGLLGVSETSSDMRDLLAHEADDHRAAEAVALFCYQAKKWLGAFTAVLGGLDTLVFAGGIGENAAPVRTRICEGLGYLGIELAESRNTAHALVISTDDSRVTVRVIRKDEELTLAQSVKQVLNLNPSRSTAEVAAIGHASVSSVGLRRC